MADSSDACFLVLLLYFLVMMPSAPPTGPAHRSRRLVWRLGSFAASTTSNVLRLYFPPLLVCNYCHCVFGPAHTSCCSCSPTSHQRSAFFFCVPELLGTKADRSSVRHVLRTSGDLVRSTKCAKACGVSGVLMQLIHRSVNWDAVRQEATRTSIADESGTGGKLPVRAFFTVRTKTFHRHQTELELVAGNREEEKRLESRIQTLHIHRLELGVTSASRQSDAGKKTPPYRSHSNAL